MTSKKRLYTNASGQGWQVETRSGAASIDALASDLTLVLLILGERFADTMTLEEIRKDRALLNAIDWDMTPEEAVRLYLEWGNNWAGGNYVIRSKADVTHYFVVNTWDLPPKIYLIRRNSELAEELAEIEMPKDLGSRFLETVGHNKGVYSIDGEVRDWIFRRLYPV